MRAVLADLGAVTAFGVLGALMLGTVARRATRRRPVAGTHQPAVADHETTTRAPTPEEHTAARRLADASWVWSIAALCTAVSQLFLLDAVLGLRNGLDPAGTIGYGIEVPGLLAVLAVMAVVGLCIASWGTTRWSRDADGAVETVRA
jgi:hypothetical protein